MEKRYEVHSAVQVNTDIAKKGYKWKYSGRVEDYKQDIENFNEWRVYTINSLIEGKCHTPVGIRITDTFTDRVIYEDLLV